MRDLRYSQGYRMEMRDQSELTTAEAEALSWAQQHAPADAAQIERELLADRDATGLTAEPSVNAQPAQRMPGGLDTFSLTSLGEDPETAAQPGTLARSGTSRGVREEFVRRDVELEGLDEPHVISHSEEQRETVRVAIDKLPRFEKEVFYHIFGQGLTVRQTAAELRAPSHMRVQRALDAIKLVVRAALDDAAVPAA